MKGGQDQQRFLDDGTPVLDVQITWTDDTITDAVDDAKANGRLLTLLLTVVPIIGFVGGLLLPARRLVPPVAHPAGRRSARGRDQGQGRRRDLRLTLSAAPSPRRTARSRA